MHETQNVNIKTLCNSKEAISLFPVAPISWVPGLGTIVLRVPEPDITQPITRNCTTQFFIHASTH